MYQPLPPKNVTLVLVHGAHHGPWCWDLLRAELTRPDDPPTVAVDLPSASWDVSTLSPDRDGDVAAIRRAVADADGPVVVMAHSAGGTPATEALGDLPDVVGIIYLCAIMLDEGQSPADLHESLADWWEAHQDVRYIDPVEPGPTFYHDVVPELRDWAIGQLRHQALSPAPLRRAAWHTVPSTYVVCDHDRAIAPALQLLMASHAGTVTHLPTGHSPFLSHPTELATLVRSLVAGFAGRRTGPR